MKPSRKLAVPEALVVTVVIATGVAAGCGSDGDEPRSEPCRVQIAQDGAIVRTGDCDAGRDTPGADDAENVDGVV